MMRCSIRCVAGLLLGSLASLSWGQSVPDGFDLRTADRRAQTVARLSAVATRDRVAAEAWAARNRVPRVVNRDSQGRSVVLVRLDENGLPEFMASTNLNAAISTGANIIQQAPYGLTGDGVRVGVWEAGSMPRLTHLDFSGAALSAASGQLTGVGNHATHVVGTIVSQGNLTYTVSGSPTRTTGMAPRATVIAYDVDNDLAEMTALGSSSPLSPTGVVLSNHSYAILAGWDTFDYDHDNNPATATITYPAWYGPWETNSECRWFGNYNSAARDFDLLAVAAPYYLIVRSAANERDDTPPTSGTQFIYFNPDPVLAAYNPLIHPGRDGGAGGYDTIATRGVAKNILVVGAAADAVSGGLRNVAPGTIASFSSYGPTDDGRIKPDIVANGISLVSLSSSSDASYSILSGTSMSSPNAAGSAALIVQHFRNKFPGQEMLASTLKGLILNTADDVGNPGPDFAYGWGYMNAKAAADVITQHGASPARGLMREGTLATAAEVDTFQVYSNGTEPLRVTLCWIDPAGAATTVLNNPSPRLVNNLELRVVGPDNTTYFPFRLDGANPATPATTGVNSVDNSEQVLIATPPGPGIYTVSVSISGSLSSAPQSYSLITTGQSTAPAGVAPWEAYQ